MVADWVATDIDWNSKLYGWVGEYLVPIEKPENSSIFLRLDQQIHTATQQSEYKFLRIVGSKLYCGV